MSLRSDKRREENTCYVRGRGECVVESPIYYRVNDDNTGPELLLEVCNERGWRSWDVRDGGMDENPQQWHVWWRHSFPGSVYRRLKNNQVLNHISRANGLCRKDVLARTLQKMSNAFPQAFDFSPSAFLLPGDYTKLVAEYTRIVYHSKSSKSVSSSQEDPVSPSYQICPEMDDDFNIWICKPTGSSQGKGISLFKDLHDLTYTGSAVVQRYLEHPLLVGGYKCDVRLYVLVTSFIPLSIYIYSEGVVRFGTEKYDLKSLDNPYSHLTNTSINRMSPGYKMEKNRVGTGCKWTLRQLRRHLKSNGQKDWLLWQKVNILVSLTLLTQVGRISYNSYSQMPSSSDQPRFGTCFELYGFDILVDQNLTPWLLEVNRCPSLTYDCDVDRVVKKPLLHHLFDLVGPPKVSQPIESPLKVATLPQGFVATLKRENETISKASETDKLQIDVMTRPKRSSLCEDCDETCSRVVTEPPASSSASRNNCQSLALLRWRNRLRTSKPKPMPPRVNRILNALSYSDGNVSSSRKRSVSSNHSFSCSSGRRRRSLSSHEEDTISDSIGVEETSRDMYIPLTNSFQKLRRQIISDFSILNRYHSSHFSSLESASKPVPHRRDGRPQHKQPPKCGDWIRTFPYNAATLHGSRNPLYIKSMVAELLKYRKVSEKVFREESDASDDFLDSQVRKLTWGDHVLWSPKKI